MNIRLLFCSLLIGITSVHAQEKGAVVKENLTIPDTIDNRLLYYKIDFDKCFFKLFSSLSTVRSSIYLKTSFLS